MYAIPANYTDSGKLLGGMVEPRNAVEAVALVIMVGYPEVKWIPMPTTIRIVIMTVTLIPLAVVAFMGIGGDSLLQYLGHILSFWETGGYYTSGGSDTSMTQNSSKARAQRQEERSRKSLSLFSLSSRSRISATASWKQPMAGM